MKILMVICTLLLGGLGFQNHHEGRLKTQDNFVLKKGIDQHIIYEGSKGERNASLWNVAVEVPDLRSQVYFTIRQAAQVKSFRLPQSYRGRAGDIHFRTTGRVTDICPFDVGINSNLSIVMSTDEEQDVQVRVGLHLLKDTVGWSHYRPSETFNEADVTTMTLKLGSPIVKYVSVEPMTKDSSSPPFYNVDLTASQESDCICSIVSIQKASCPYSDLLEASMRYGIWQTMLTKSTLVVDARKYPSGFLVVVVASPSDKLCHVKNNENKCDTINQDKDHNKLSKDITITVKKNASTSDYIIGIVVVACGYFFLLVLSLSISFIRFSYNIDSYEDLKEVLQESIPTVPFFSTAVDSSPNPAAEKTQMEDLWNVTKAGTSRLKDVLNSTPKIKEGEVVNNSDDVDGITKKITSEKATNELNHSDTFIVCRESIQELFYETDYIKGHKFRLKRDLNVSEMSQKLYDPSKQKSIYKKSTLYVGNLLLMSIFYCLPVLQMVTEANSQIEETGNHDLCYFNHLCLKPLGELKDFNHVFSNLGYVFLGFLFIGLVYVKERRFLKLSEKLQHNFGVPQQFGLFYAMGLALAMEGILSACYHVCPTTIAFQFDTTYMYLMAVLMQMKIYQSRHADIVCSANPAYLGLGIALILEAVSIYHHGPAFWTIFCIVYFLFIIFFVTHHYHMGVIRHDRRLFWNVIKLVFAELKKLYHTIKCNRVKGCHVPTVRSRFIFLVITSVFNTFLCLYFAFRNEKYASNYLLYVFMGNMFAYLVYYVTMKLLSGEKPTWESWLYLISGNIMAIPAMYLFTTKEKSSDLSPAESRALNRDCIFLNFYDGHDVWHFLGGGGVFFVFMFLLTIDEDVKYTRRDLIHVF